MKTRIYLRLGKSKKGCKVVASTKPNFQALDNGTQYNHKSNIAYPTIQIALDLDIPDKEFDKARVLLDAKIKSTEPCVEIKQVNGK